MYKLSIKRPVTTIMVMLIVVLAGIISMMGLNLDMMPNIDIPMALVSTTYIGAGPEEMETLITKPLEETLGTVSNVKQISSTSSANSSMIMIQLEDGTDVDMAAIDIREKVDLVKRSLPEDANDPMVIKLDVAAMSSIMVGVSSSNLDLAELNSLLEDTISNRFERIEGVAAVSLVGGVEDEVQVIVNPEKMQGYGVTESQISQLLASENLNYPTGSVHQGNTKMQVRSVGEFKSIEEIQSLPLTSSSGAQIHLSDVAVVQKVQKETTSDALINGEAAVILVIQKQSNANTVDISDKVNKEITKVLRDYPNLHIEMLSDTADYIKTSISNIISTAVQAAVLAVVILFIFLRDPKTSLVIGISIPTSIIATFALMYLNNMTMNMISMGGIAIGIGMLVDNSVVVLENIFKHWNEGMEGKKASERGAGEVAMAVTASTLTTVAVFIPLMFVKGTMGDMFQDLSLTITFSLFASLVVSLTFVPMACSLLLKTQEKKIVKKVSIFSKLLNMWGHGLEKLDAGYRRVLSWSLLHKKRVMLLVVVLFFATLSLVPIIGMDLMPAMDQGSIGISIEMPKGTVIEETQAMVGEVLDRIDGIPEKEVIYATVGGGGISLSGNSTDSGAVQMNLVEKEDRDRSTKEVVREIKGLLADIPGADITVSEASSAMGSMGGSGISIQLNGDDTSTLREIGLDIQALIADVDGISDVSTSAEDSVPEASIRINREKAAAYGVTSGQVATAVSTAVTGTVATQYKLNGTEIDIRIMQDKDSVKYMDQLKNIMITAPTGARIPLSEVCDVVIQDGALSITRIDQHKYITVDAVVDGRDIASVQKDLEAKLATYIFPDGYEYQFTGSLEDMAEAYSSLMLVFVVAILLVYMIMASQFESLIHPFIVMFSIPLAVTGGIFGLFVTGKTITVTAFMGFIMLVGMVVNNGIVLIDAANQIVAKGKKNAYEALIEAGPDRLRPILMTTLTTILGLVPMALGIGEGMEMQQPLAISVISGLTISTLVTLIFIPVLYMLVDKFRLRHIRAKRSGKKKRKETIEEINSTIG